MNAADFPVPVPPHKANGQTRLELQTAACAIGSIQIHQTEAGAHIRREAFLTVIQKLIFDGFGTL